MPPEPKPYVENDWYCMSIGGVQHRKLCRVTDDEFPRLPAHRTDGNLAYLVRLA